MSSICPMCTHALTGDDPQVEATFLYVSMPPGSDAPSLRNERLLVLLDLWVHGPCCRIIFDCAPQVRPVLHLKQYDYLPESIAHGHRQHCHLEWEQVRHGGRGWRMAGKRWVRHSQ